jgi:hypothetical protein
MSFAKFNRFFEECDPKIYDPKIDEKEVKKGFANLRWDGKPDHNDAVARLSIFKEYLMELNSDQFQD